jgi:hypothetical protein
MSTVRVVGWVQEGFGPLCQALQMQLDAEQFHLSTQVRLLTN